MVLGLYQLHHLCDVEYLDFRGGGVARSLCLFALSLLGRQAIVLLAAHQPHGASCRFRLAFFFQLYSAVELFDTHLAVALAHTLFNVPLAVWILEGFMGGVPKELDETAYVDGYSFPKFFVTVFIPSIKAGVGVAAFFCFMFSWVELLLAKTLTAVAAKPIAATMTKTASSAGYELGLLAAAGTLTIIPGAIVIYFVRNYIAKGFAMGRV